VETTTRTTVTYFTQTKIKIKSNGQGDINNQNRKVMQRVDQAKCIEPSNSPVSPHVESCLPPFLPQSVVRSLLFPSRHSPFTLNHVFGRGNCVAAPPCVCRKGKELAPRTLATNPATGDLLGGRPLLLDLH
jgi:hypothetical protein